MADPVSGESSAESLTALVQEIKELMDREHPGSYVEVWSLTESTAELGVFDFSVSLHVVDRNGNSTLVADFLPGTRDYTGVPTQIRWTEESCWIYGPAEIAAFIVRAVND